jgi:hypothetical protein
VFDFCQNSCSYVIAQFRPKTAASNDNTQPTKRVTCMSVCVCVRGSPGHAHGPGIGHARPRALAPQAPYATAFHYRADSKPFATNYKNSRASHLKRAPLAKRPPSEATMTARSSAKRSAGSHWPKLFQFSAASHILPKRPAAERRRARAAARCCAPQSSPRVQTTVAPSSLRALPTLLNTVSGVPPVGIFARRGTTPPSGAPCRPSMALCGPHTRT